MKKSLLMKSLLLLFALVVGTGSSWADNASVSINTYATANSWVNETAYSSVTIDSHVSVSSVTGGNNGKYYSSDKTWRHYEGDNGAITIAVTGGTLNSVTFTYSVGNNGVLKYNSSNVSSGTACTAVNGATSATFSVAHSSGTKNGNVRITAITVTYTPAASFPLDHITLSGTYPTEFNVGDTFSHDGMTVTAHFEDSSTSDVSSSATFTGYDMSTPGNQTVTVSYTKGAVTKTATYNITVLPALTPVVTLDLTDAGWGFPSEYKTDAATYTNNGYTISFGASSNGHKKCIVSGDVVSLIYGKENATLNLPAFGFNVSKIKVYGQPSASGKVTLNVFVGSTAVSSEATSSQVEHDFAIAAASQAAGTIYTIKVTNANNCQISKIEVYGDGCEAGLVGEAGWATYVTTAPVRFAEGDAFAVTSASDVVYMETVTDVPSNTPVVLKGAGQKTAILLDADPAAISNELAISTGGSVDGYVLAKKNDVVGFYKWNGGSLTSGKVYLPSSAVTTPSRSFIGFEGGVTGINEVKGEKKAVEGIFDLQGRKVVTPSKGLYIVNGKKVIIK